MHDHLPPDADLSVSDVQSKMKDLTFSYHQHMYIGSPTIRLTLSVISTYHVYELLSPLILHRPVILLLRFGPLLHRASSAPSAGKGATSHPEEAHKHRCNQVTPTPLIACEGEACIAWGDEATN